MRQSRCPHVVRTALVASLLAPAAAAQGNQITGESLGPIQMCEPLRRVKVLFPSARDTVLTREYGSGWPSKVVPLGNGEWIIFESSWVDTGHVWRFTTNSRKYQTPSGARVGMSIKDLLDRHEKTTEITRP